MSSCYDSWGNRGPEIFEGRDFFGDFLWLNNTVRSSCPLHPWEEKRRLVEKNWKFFVVSSFGRIIYDPWCCFICLPSSTLGRKRTTFFLFFSGFFFQFLVINFQTLLPDIFLDFFCDLEVFWVHRINFSFAFKKFKQGCHVFLSFDNYLKPRMSLVHHVSFLSKAIKYLKCDDYFPYADKMYKKLGVLKLSSVLNFPSSLEKSNTFSEWSCENFFPQSLSTTETY